MRVPGLIHGIPVETKTTSWTGKYLYSDRVNQDAGTVGIFDEYALYHDTFLNKVIRIPIIGILGGVTRMVLSIIHTIGHLLAALFTQDKGHLYHAAKGVCEFTRGFIETLPIIGRIFANVYQGFWMIKIYNPDQPDDLDTWGGYWANENWQRYYVKA